MMCLRVTRGVLWGLLHVPVIMEGFSEEVTFEPKLERQEGASGKAV